MKDWLFHLFSSGAFLILALYFSVPVFYWLQSRRDKKKLFRRLIAGKLNPHGFEMRMELGEIYTRARRWSAAEAELREAVEIHEDHAHCQSLLGISLYHQGKFEEAASRFERALELRPSEGYGRTQVLLARSYEALGKEEEAIRWYDAALERNRSICEPAHRLGLLHEKRKETAPARESYMEAIRRFTPTDRRNYWRNLWFSGLAKWRVLRMGSS